MIFIVDLCVPCQIVVKGYFNSDGINAIFHKNISVKLSSANKTLQVIYVAFSKFSKPEKTMFKWIMDQHD